MSKILFILIFSIFSSSLYSYNAYESYGMCDKYADIKVNKSIFPIYWRPRIIEITKNVLNYWNEAGSQHSL